MGAAEIRRGRFLIGGHLLWVRLPSETTWSSAPSRTASSSPMRT
jgi:hypothetical protein